MFGDDVGIEEGSGSGVFFGEVIGGAGDGTIGGGIEEATGGGLDDTFGVGCSLSEP